MSEKLQAPFPWFGGKSRVADLVWSRFGNVPNYVEPFFGSGAVMLGRPHEPQIETINDFDGYVANFWRAIQADADAVARWADWPQNEADLHARHLWLVRQDGLAERLMADPDYYDAKVAGWWVWGICLWIGSGWCSGDGPWTEVGGRLVRQEEGRGINRQRIHLGNKGQGINRQLIHLGNKGRGINRKLIHLGNKGQGINRKRIHLGNKGVGIFRQRIHLTKWFGALQDRLRRVRVCCGDWARVCGPTPTIQQGITGVFLDPPYAEQAARTDDLYRIDSSTVANDVREWALANGDDPRMRIALCGYEGEHNMPDDWDCIAWKANGGYGRQANGHDNPNARRERIWFSPHCLRPERQPMLWDFVLDE